MPSVDRERLQRAISTHGVGGVAKLGADKVKDQFHRDQDQVWYVFDLERVERLPLAEGYELRLADERDLELVGRLPSVTVTEARQRYDEGVQTWLVVRDEDPAFACWIFPRATPVTAVKGGTLELPDRVACLEDSVTSPDHRGKGIAPAAWTAIAERLPGEGFDVLITKVATDNAPSRKAVEKAGFRGANVMHYRRRGVRTRVYFTRLDGELTPAEQGTLAELERRLGR